MSLPPVLLFVFGVPMLVVGTFLIVRWFQRNNLGKRPIDPKPQDAKGPVRTQSALLGALLISLGLLLSAFGLAALFAGQGT